MKPETEVQLAYQVMNSPIRMYPYPHIYVEDVFPADFYDELQRNIPHPDSMLPIAQVRPVKGYKERFVMDPQGPMEGCTGEQRTFWNALSHGLRDGAFRNQLISKFRPMLNERFKGQQVEIFDETLLVEDITKYSLGPHSDSSQKVITVLFYLPKDMSQVHLGTSVYVPKDPNFVCPGGPHYPREGFTRVATMPFKPNSMFAFVKNDRSFHGVEPVNDEGVKRWLLLYDIRMKAPPKPATT